MARRFGGFLLAGVLSATVFAAVPARATSGLVYARASNWVYRMEITAATVNDAVRAGVGQSHLYTLDASYDAQVDLACVSVAESGTTVTVRGSGISTDGRMFHLFMTGNTNTRRGTFGYKEIAPDPAALSCDGWQVAQDEATDVNVEWIASN